MPRLYMYDIGKESQLISIVIKINIILNNILMVYCRY